MKEALVFQGVLKNAVVRAPLPAASDEERARSGGRCSTPDLSGA